MDAWRGGVRFVGGALEVGPGLATVVLSLVLFLVLGTIVRGWLLLRRADPIRRQRWRSVATWWVLTGLLLVILAVGRPAVFGVMALLSLLLLREALRLLGRESLLPAGMAAVGATYVWAWLGGPSLFLGAFPALATVWGLVEARGAVEARLTRVRFAARAAFLALVGPSYVVAVASLPAPGGPSGSATGEPAMAGSELGWLVLLLVLTELNDSAQAWGGRAFGSGRMAPRLSPAKTWAGLWSGIGATVAASMVLAPRVTGYGRVVPALAGGSGLAAAPLWLWPLGVGVLVSLAGVAGDLLESSVKRRVGVTDSGDLLPGHGGFMDRFDSLAVTAPVFYAVTWVLWS